MFMTFIKRISFFIMFFSHTLVAETIDGVVFYDESILFQNWINESNIKYSVKY
jgi:hypothetical protein